MAVYYESKPQFLSKGVVLCQPGLFCTEYQFEPMWKTMNRIADATTIRMNDEILMQDNINDVDIIAALKRQASEAKVSFFKTLFRNKIGRVDDQVEELHSIVLKVKEIFGDDVPIFLVGYSKGGLVNMRYATLKKGYVKNITSIGTPYLNSFLQKALSLADDVIGVPLYTIAGTKIVDMNRGIRELLDSYLSDEDLGDDAFFTKLKNDWNSIPLNKKPYITCIACSQIGFENNPEDGFDLIVSVEAQKATGFNNINQRVLIDDNFEYINHSNWYDCLYKLSAAMAIEIETNISWGIREAIVRKDFLYALFAFVLAIIPYTWDMSKYNLIHTQELGNENVCKAVLSSINKLNPYLKKGY